MTNEQRLLIYLYGVPSIQRRQLVIALPEIPYQSLTLAVRKAKEHGYIEVFRKDDSNHIRLSPEGVKYIRQKARDSLDTKKRADAKRRYQKERTRRLERVETTSNLCRAAGIPLAKEVGITISDLTGPESEEQEKFFDSYFQDKGLLFLSDELSNGIRALGTMGEEYFSGRSRLIGVVINVTGVYYLYCTLDRLMKWNVGYEQRRITAITAMLMESPAAENREEYRAALEKPPKSVIIGKTCAMLPKIVTGDKYGVTRDRGPGNDITNTLMTLANLERCYRYNYYVPTNTLGVELLSRTVTLTREDLNGMIEMWLKESGEGYTAVLNREYLEVYREKDEDKTLVFPVLELEELVYQKAHRERYHIICERGTQDGVSRVMGQKTIDFRDFEDRLMPFHRYDDDGIRCDGVNPLTMRGYEM